MTQTLRVGVLASGEGTNLQAILDRVHGRAWAQVVAVGSNRRDARALDRASGAGVPFAAFELDDHPDRAARDIAMAAWLEAQAVDLVVMAGYMQLVTPGFLASFPDRVINVHPALLPAFPGVGAVEQALAYGVKLFGVTVHFVDEGVDSGRIIAQRAVELLEVTEAEPVRTALRPIEHDLLCETIMLIATGAVRLDPTHRRRVLVTPGIVSPR